MSSKRKAKSTSRLGIEKRKCMTWNLYDAPDHNGDLGDNNHAALNGSVPASQTAKCSIEINNGHESLSANDENDIKEEVSQISRPPHSITKAIYQLLWNESDYGISIQPCHHIPSDLVGILGSFNITLACFDHDDPHRSSIGQAVTTEIAISDLPAETCTLFVSSKRDAMFLMFDEGNSLSGFRSHIPCYKALVNDDVPLENIEYLCRTYNGSHMTLVVLENDHVGGDTFIVSVCIRQSALRHLNSPVDRPRMGTRHRDIRMHYQHVMKHFHGFPVSEMAEIKTLKNFNVNQVFHEVHEVHNEEKMGTNGIDIQHYGLVPMLRPYQEDAVRWMLRKECYGPACGGDAGDEDTKRHFLWHEVQIGSDQPTYYNPFLGCFTQQKFLKTLALPGGILADEMGLGKTVEVLACILNHPRPVFHQEDEAEDEDTAAEDEATVEEGDGPKARVDGDSLRDDQIAQGSNSACISGDEQGNSENLVPVESHMACNSERRMGSEENINASNPGDLSRRLEDGNTSNKLENIEKDVSWQSGSTNAAENEKRFGVPENPTIQLHETQRICYAGMPRESQLVATEKVFQNPDDQNCVSSMAVITNLGGELDSSSKDVVTSHKDDPAAIMSKHSLGTLSTQDLSGSETNVTDDSGFVESFDESSDHRLDQSKTEIEEDSLVEDSMAMHTTAGNMNLHVTQDVKNMHVTTYDVNMHVTEDDMNMHITEESRTVCMAESSMNNHEPTEEQSAHVTDDSGNARDRSGNVQLKTEEDGLVAGVLDGPHQTENDSEVQPTHIKEELTFKTENFHCSCGKIEDIIDCDLTIQCSKCRGWQHIKCVNYQPPSRRRANREPYLCPHCWIQATPVTSSATLIITPSSISHQWIDEINRHIRSSCLKILVYKGVKKHGFLQPKFLASHDIVITTYNVLKQELNYVDLPHANVSSGRKFRHAKRYMAIPSPMPVVDWWRICLDEAQMVECPTAKSAEMALRLTGVNRWCVTGTPVQRSLDDLYGLFLFLGVDPFWVKHWWDVVLCAPFARGDRGPMLKALTQTLWRTAKKDVLDQINIPSQTEEIHWLTFSAVEEHFYKKKHEACAGEFTWAMNRVQAESFMKLAELDRSTLSKLVGPLLRLRQACCHPQAVRGEFLPLNQSTMTMKELLHSLIDKDKLECEEAQRLLICSLNGLAAVHLIQGEVLEAIGKYREVLSLGEEHKDKLKMDSLQLLHAMHNLQQLLGNKPEGVIPTIRDNQLLDQISQLRRQYLSRSESKVCSCQQTLQICSDKVQRSKTKIKDGPGWWLDAVQYLVLEGLEEELIERVKDELTAQTNNFYSLAARFRNGRGLQLTLQAEIDILQDHYKRAQDAIATVSVDVTPQLLNSATECHLRPFMGIATNDCAFCQVEKVLQDYEMRLFAFEPKEFSDAIKDEPPSTSSAADNELDNYILRPRGTWGMSEVERILKVVQTFLKAVHGDPYTIEEGNVFLEMLDHMKKEFKPLRAFWGSLRDKVAAMDELEMAMMRLRLRIPGEPYDQASQPYIVEQGAIFEQRMKLMHDQILARSDLRRKMGQLVYLENLAKSQYGDHGGKNPDPCPICTRPLGEQWTVLHCGHCYCLECMEILRSRNLSNMRRQVKCAICREETSSRMISLVSTKVRHPNSEAGDVAIKGGHSTKVEAVVRTLLNIRKKDPTAKALVFSTWQDMLNIISMALVENEVVFRRIFNVGHKTFQHDLVEFKVDPDVTALLMPLHIGSNGLNIIEATHVLLVEPCLNPSIELQAVGRVHRIGQTRSTVVHRFLVRNTIEEKLQGYLLANPVRESAPGTQVSETGAMTVGDLRGMLTFDKDEST